MDFKFTDPRLEECQTVFDSLDPEQAIVMSHFDLAKKTEIKDKDLWKSFLQDVRVAEYLYEELALYKDAQQRKLIQRATTNDKAVGTAQMINALGKAREEDSNKSGSVFVYSYVPLNQNEADSPCANVELTDIFEKE